MKTQKGAINIATGKFARPARKKPLWPVVITVCATLALIALFLLLGLPLLRQALDPYGGRIVDGVSVAGVSLGGMTQEEAVRVLEDQMPENLALLLPGKALELPLRQVGIQLDVQGLAKAAYAVGRTAENRELDFAPYLSFREDSLRIGLEETARELSQSGIQTGWALEGALPELSEDRFQPEGPLPSLAVTLGVASYRLDVEAACQQTVSALLRGELEVDLSSCVTSEGGEMPEAEAIIKEASVEPVDAALNRETGQAAPGSYGFTFDREKLDALLKSAAPGQTVRLEAELTAPQVLGQEVYFQDVLGFCQTPHSDDEKRNTNLQLACKALNGVIMEPGETLSYNATLGQRTEEAGYQSAPAYSGVDLVNTLGGGICQVSSTLYLCSLYAELETVERVSHGFPASYMPVGLDATVSWGTPDLKIKNNSDYPVKLVAETQEGFVRVWIMGVETRDYYVRMGFSSSSDGYAKSYVCKYDRQTNERISREDCAYSSYFTDDLSVSGEIGSGEIYRYGNVREQPHCDPTPETLAEALNYQKPNTRG